MTNQEIFDRVVRHLAKQGRPAAYDDGTCAYRMPDGEACAIGCLIPDENYSRRLEGKSCYQPSVRAAAGLTAEQANGIGAALQRCHDQEWTPGRGERMFDHLRFVAGRFGLDDACVVEEGVEAFCYE